MGNAASQPSQQQQQQQQESCFVPLSTFDHHTFFLLGIATPDVYNVSTINKSTDSPPTSLSRSKQERPQPQLESSTPIASVPSKTLISTLVSTPMMEPLRLTAATHVRASSPLEEPATRQTEVVAVSLSMLQERWLPLAQVKRSSVVTSEEAAAVDLAPARHSSDEVKDEPLDESDIHPLLRTSVQAAAETKEIGPTQVDTKPNIIPETASPDVDLEPLHTSSQVETLPSLGNDAPSADKEEAKEAASDTSTADASTSHPEIVSTDVLDLESSAESDVHPMLESNAQFITETCDLDTSVISTTATTLQDDDDIVSPSQPTAISVYQPAMMTTLPESQTKPDTLDVAKSSMTAPNYTTPSTDNTTTAAAASLPPTTTTTTTTTTTERPATPADSLHRVPTASTSTTTAPSVLTTTTTAATAAILPPPHTAYTSSIPSPPPTGIGESPPVTTTRPLTAVASISSAAAVDEQAAEMNTYTMREVAKHSSARDCWLVIDGDVYDCTEFAARHPGGAKVLFGVAGKDATKKFDKYHRRYILEKYKPELRIGVVGSDQTTSGAGAKPKRGFLGRLGMGGSSKK